MASVSKKSPTQGRKRLRNGQLKKDVNARSLKSGANATKLGQRLQEEPELNGRDQFEQEVISFGGTKDDIELLGDIESGSELDGGDVDQDRMPGKLTNREIREVVGQLGIDKVEPHDETDETDEDPEDDSEQWEREEPALKHQSQGHGKEARGLNRAGDFREEGEAPKPPRQGKIELIFPIQSDWHQADLPELPTSTSSNRPSSLADRVHHYAKMLLEEENVQYAASQKKGSSAHQFYSTLMSTGTLSDKISALTLSIQESPLHNMKAMESLLTLARKRSRDQAVNVLGALKDLFGPGNILPSDRRLKTFLSQPSLSLFLETKSSVPWTAGSPLPAPLGKSHLVSWAFEDWLKSTYFQVLRILEDWCNDEVTFARSKAIEFVSQLLKEKPEQEANLLRILVNKLGDSDKKVASKTSYYILQLENAHPFMKTTIINAVEADLLFRPGQSLHAQYYAIVTLNQTVLSSKEQSVARKLLDVYFSLFMKLLEKPRPPKQAAVATEDIKLNKKGQIQGGGGALGKRALQNQEREKKSTATEEELREKLLSAVLTGINRAIPYVDANDEFLEKHLETLFRVTHSSNFNTGIQALMLIQQVSGVHLNLQDRFYRVLYESLLDPRLLESSKQALYLNMLYRALKADLNVDRVKAFVKRLLQTSLIHQTPFVCGVLYMIRELEKVFPALSKVVDEVEYDDSDEEENFRDIQDDMTAPQLLQRSSTDKEPSANGQNPHHSKYDARKRDPLHALAARAALWELTPSILHYHPSVALFSTRLLAHDDMPPIPDLQQNTLIHFLDRFVYKNPKAANIERAKGISIMQPLAANSESNVLLSTRSFLSRAERPVNNEAFRRQDSGKVSADEVFFHQYFSQVGASQEKAKQRKEKKEKKRKKREESDEESEEEEIWKALVDSKPDIEGDAGSADFSEDEIDDDFDAAMRDSGSNDEFASEVDGEHGAIDGLLSGSDSGDFDLMESGDDDIESDTDGESSRPDPSSIPYRIGKGGRGRKALRGLPTFAAADDYAAMLRDEEST